MRTRAAVASLILTPLSITVLVASCNPGTPSGGDAGDANADGPFSCNPPPDYANCASCVDGDGFPREFDGVVGTGAAVGFRGNLTVTSRLVTWASSSCSGAPVVWRSSS